jgi:hypothetical protein
MLWLRNFYRKNLETIIRNDPVLAENKLLNQNKISEQILVNFFVKIVKLALIIFHICYFLGLVWYIMAYIYYAEMLDIQKVMENLEAANLESFYEYYHIGDNTPTRNTIVGLYFAFTTLSTVGFGDYAPRGNFERGLGAFVLISGVAMFSYLMGSFIDILSTY